jgi:hypothetical protein
VMRRASLLNAEAPLAGLFDGRFVRGGV